MYSDRFVVRLSITLISILFNNNYSMRYYVRYLHILHIEYSFCEEDKERTI